MLRRHATYAILPPMPPILPVKEELLAERRCKDKTCDDVENSTKAAPSA